MRIVSALLALLLAGCVASQVRPGFECLNALSLCPAPPTKQRCEWSNCAGPVQTQADWSSIYAPYDAAPHVGRDGRVAT